MRSTTRDSRLYNSNMGNTGKQIGPKLVGRRRDILRRVLYSLPARYQFIIGGIKRPLLGEDDWAARTKQLRLREDDFISATAARNSELPGRKRIAIYSLHHFSPREYGVAMALKLRGHDVKGILCDGLLPLCEMNLGQNLRPPCDACIMNLSRFEDAFGFEYTRLKQFLSDADLERATQLVNDTSVDELSSLQVNGVPVGLFAHREIQRYYRGFIFEPKNDPAFRKWLISAVLLTWLSERWLDQVMPDIVGVCSGRTLPTACIYEVARQRSIHVVTWDGVATKADGLMFSHNEMATEVPLDSLWPKYRDVPLTPEQENELSRFMGSWARSEVTPFPYNPVPLEDETQIRNQLGLRKNAPLVVAYTNTSWDIAVIDRDVGFANMFDWVFALVEFAKQHPQIDLVIRAHPAEKKVPAELQSRTPVGPEIRKRFELTQNIKIVEGDDPISSYTLSRIAQVNILYASRLGLEIALRGTRPWLAGAVTYRNKGFTLDLASREHMISLLEQVSGGTATSKTDQLSESEITLAQRFAYLWFFRYEVRLPVLHPPNKRFALNSFAELAPGGDPTIEAICEAFVTNEPFIELSSNHSGAYAPTR